MELAGGCKHDFRCRLLLGICRKIQRSSSFTSPPPCLGEAGCLQVSVFGPSWCIINSVGLKSPSTPFQTSQKVVSMKAQIGLNCCLAPGCSAPLRWQKEVVLVAHASSLDQSQHLVNCVAPQSGLTSAGGGTVALICGPVAHHTTLTQQTLVQHRENEPSS